MSTQNSHLNIAALLALTLASSIIGHSLVRQTDIRKRNVARVDVLEADFMQCIDLITRQIDVKIVVEPSSKHFHHITLSLENRPLDDVLRRICKQAGAEIRFEDGTYILSPASTLTEELGLVWEMPTPGALPQALAIDVHNPNVLYVALKSAGMAVYERRPGAAPVEIARLPISRFAGQDVMHLAQRGQTLYVALGDHFAAGGAKAGIAAINIADPSSPSILGVWTTPRKVTGAAAIALDERYAYLGAMKEGVMVFDTSDPAHLHPVSTFKPDPNWPRQNPDRFKYPNARGLAVAGNRVYVAYDGGGLRVLDITDRANPREVGRFANPAMSSKQAAYNNVVIDGNLLYAAVDYAGLEVIDISGAQMLMVGWWNPWKADTLRNLWFNSPGHTNQIGLDRTKKLIYLSAGDSELQVVDVSNPPRPKLAGYFGAVNNGRGSWGMTLGEKVVYLLDIKAVIPFKSNWSGIVAINRL